MLNEQKMHKTVEDKNYFRIVYEKLKQCMDETNFSESVFTSIDLTTKKMVVVVYERVRDKAQLRILFLVFTLGNFYKCEQEVNGSVGQEFLLTISDAFCSISILNHIKPTLFSKLGTQMNEDIIWLNDSVKDTLFELYL